MRSLFTSIRLKITVPALPRVRRGIFKSKLKMCLTDEDGTNNKRKSDDLSSREMTLKELKKRSKKKKKLLESVGLPIPIIGSDSCHDTKQDDTSAIIKVEESDFEMPLSAWKRKVSNNVKHTYTRKKLCSSVDSAIAVTEPIRGSHEDSSGSAKDKHDPPNTVNEITELECSEYQTGACSISDGSAPKAPAGDTENMISSSSFSSSTGCVFNEALFDYANRDPISHRLSDTSIFKETTDRGSPLVINEIPTISESELPKVDSSRHAFEKPNPGIVRCKGYTFRLKTSSCKADSHVANQVPDDIIQANHPAENLSYGGSSCVTDVKSEDHSSIDTDTLNCKITENSKNLHISSMDLSPSPSTDALITSNGSLLAENHSDCASSESRLANTDGVVECVQMISPIASNELTPSEELKSEYMIRAESVPRKLFSTRKAISPTSQEKLWHAMDAEELNDSMGNPESSPMGSKISFGKVCGKSKKNINGSPQLVPKGILRASPISGGSPLDSTETSYIPSCAQKAVAFSQRQMLDIESLAGKLVKELKSMKDMVEESLNYDEFSSIPKYTSDEMQKRNALQNATEVEETTKRWLSMMARDCNRFCKIMRSTGKTSSASAERKKIIFADEAGGLLCHVKILEELPDSGDIPESESVQ